MDMQKIGNFLTTLRKEKNLTQEELGDKIGVTNKTVSRWETGTYLPPVEMLQILGNLYEVSINEILCGERLNSENYKENAEKNLIQTLNNSSFASKEKKAQLKKQWRKAHIFEMIVEMLAFVAAIVLCSLYCKELHILIIILAFVWSAIINNREAKYIEDNLYKDVDEQLKNINK